MFALRALHADRRYYPVTAERMLLKNALDWIFDQPADVRLDTGAIEKMKQLGYVK